MGRKLTDDNRLSLRYPDIASEWHPTKNSDLTPDDVSYGSSSKKVWWICKNGHDWDAVIYSRTKNGTGCPYCSGNSVSDKNRLSLHYPDLSDEWHPIKNGSLRPADVSYGSEEKVWWLCENGHEWDAIVYSRARNGNGCRFCGHRGVSDVNRLSVHYPHLVNEWHPTKNGNLTPDDVSYAKNDKVWWLCKNGHEWPAVVYSRTLSGRGCGYCAVQRVTDDNRLSLKRPELVPEWHPTKNGNLTPDNVAVGTNEKVWWICRKDKDHIWRAVIPSRAIYGTGCRYCARKEVTDVNRLSIHYPDLKNEWHPEKNGDLKPADVSYGSHEKVWWLCENGHEWEARVYSRKLGRGCGYCAGKEITDENRLSLKAPELVDEWHHERNGDLKPTDVSYGSDDKVWWFCEMGHEWEAAISSRAINGSGCRNCKLSGRSRLEIYLACELAAFFEDIDPTQTWKIITPEGKSMNVDIAIPSEKLVIEYDSLWWHDGRLDKDIEKTKRLKASGWDVLRIREEPLELVQNSDLPCQVTFGSHIKSLMDSVLNHLEEIFGIEISGLDEYLVRDSLVNEAAADEIIDKRLAKQTKVESYQLRLPYL